MAILSKTGITTGQSVEPGHITQSIDAFSGLEEYDIYLSGSFNMTGSINGEPGVINQLTSSFAISSSFSTSASFASTTKVNTATLTFFHNQVTDSTGSRVTYIGGFTTPPESTAGNIALHAPFNGTLTHCVISSLASTTAASDDATITCALSVDGGSTYPVSLGSVLLSQFTDNKITQLDTTVTAGDKINIRLTEAANSNAVWGINAVLILKS
jgi:hypothetical protein